MADSIALIICAHSIYLTVVIKHNILPLGVVDCDDIYGTDCLTCDDDECLTCDNDLVVGDETSDTACVGKPNV